MYVFDQVQGSTVMPEEKEVQVNKEEEAFIQPSIDEMIDSSPVINESKGEENAAESEEKTVENTEEAETDTTEKESEEKPEEGLTEERFKELAEKYPQLQEYKKYFEDYNNWETKLRQKSQAIPHLKKLMDESPEKLELLMNKVMPYVYGQEELPKAPSELVDDVMEKVEIGDLKFVDDDEFEVSVGKDKIEPIVRQAVEKTLNSAVPEMAALRTKLAELEKEKNEIEQNYNASVARQGELEMEQLAGKHPILDIKRLEGESILQAVERIQQGGVDHPEYHKLSKWNAIGNEAQRQGWTLEKAFKFLYGQEEKKILEDELRKKTASDNQKTATQEVPGGEKLKEKEDWEEALGDLRGSHEHAVDAYFKKHGL